MFCVNVHLGLPFIKLIASDSQLPRQLRRQLSGRLQQSDGFGFEGLGVARSFSHWTPSSGYCPFLHVHERGVAQVDSIIDT